MLNNLYQFIQGGSQGIKPNIPTTTTVIPTTTESPILYTQEILTNSAYCWFQKEFAVHDSASDKSWIGLVHNSGSGYTQHILEIDNSDFSQTVTSIGSQIEQDDHNQPTMLIKSDGKLFSTYSKHGKDTTLRYRTSANVKDATSWGSEGTFTAAGNVTYPSAFEASNGDIYIFYRATHVGFYYVKSTDGGVTFSGETKYCDDFATEPLSTPYLRKCQSPIDKDIIHFITSSGHPEWDTDVSSFAYYMDLSDDKFYDLSGTDITSSTPFTSINDGTVVFTSSDPNTSWIEDIIVDNSGNPRYLLTYYPNGRNTAYLTKELYYSEWTGSSLITPIKIHTASSTINFGGANDPSYPPLASFNKYNVDEIYASKEVSGVLEIFKLTKSGSSFSEVQISKDSQYNQWRPISIGRSEDTYNVFWLNQISYIKYNDFNQTLITLTNIEPTTTTTTTTIAPTTTTTTPTIPDLLTNLDSVFELNETTGTIAVDAHNSNDGTNVNATINQVGKVGTAYGFNGTSSYLSIPTSLSNEDGDFTHSAWVYMNTGAAAGDIIAFGSTAQDITMLRTGIDVDNKAFLFLRKNWTGASYYYYYRGDTVISDETWYHVVFTWNGTTKTGNIYINASEDTVENKSTGTESGTWDINVGRVGVLTRTSNAIYFDGTLDQVAIWNKILTSDEISELYNSGNGLAYTNWT